MTVVVDFSPQLDLVFDRNEDFFYSVSAWRVSSSDLPKLDRILYLSLLADSWCFLSSSRPVPLRQRKDANQTQVQSLPASESFLLFSALSNRTLNSSKLSWPSLLESSWKKNYSDLSLVFLHFGPIYLRINWKTGSDNQRPLRVNNLLLGSGDVQTFKLTFAISSINSFSDNFFVNFLKSFWVI